MKKLDYWKNNGILFAGIWLLLIGSLLRDHLSPVVCELIVNIACAAMVYGELKSETDRKKVKVFLIVLFLLLWVLQWVIFWKQM